MTSNQGITPHPYQKRAVGKLRKAFKRGNAALMVMATGLGKTITSALWAKDEIKSGKGVFLAHSNEILEHARREFRKVLGDKISLGIFHGFEKNFDKPKILFASLQTMRNWTKQFKDSFQWMVVDESHHGHAPTFKRVIYSLNVKKRLGITATPDRHDAQNIRDIFGKEVVNYSLEEAIAKGWLPPIEYHLITDNIDDAVLEKLAHDVLQKGERISVSEINRRVFIRTRDEKIINIIRSYSQKTLVFCQNIRHLRYLLRCFKDGGIPAVAYHSAQTNEANTKALGVFRSKTTTRLLAVNAFNEGIDVPDVEVVVFYRATQSETIFRQQLGRGLRSGKKKLVVLDFVGNIERVAVVKQLAQAIKKFQKGDGSRSSKNLLHVEGKGFNFVFTDKAVNLLKLFERTKTEFYPTWQEASIATQYLNIQTCSEYKKRYQEDNRLPSGPSTVYEDFPCWKIFLNTQKFYPTWQKASSAATQLGFMTNVDYNAGYKKDPKLSSNPGATYKDFPGWIIFLGKKEKKCYKTWQEASRAVIRLGIRSAKEYSDRYKEDPCLPSSPSQFYTDFPGYPELFGLESLRRHSFYPTWKEASAVVRRMKISSIMEYGQGHKIDLKLPSHPDKMYPDFPGWGVFLGTGRVMRAGNRVYTTLHQACRAARMLGFKTHSEYKLGYKKDPMLPSTPQRKYEDFPGWCLFLGCRVKNLYKTWEEAAKAVKRLSIKNSYLYRSGYRGDLRLPSSPDEYYKDFPGWKVFLGRGVIVS